ncbi:hypothetical protein [Pedobacter sp. V48]|uniref:hypothetical protein n=1 Tax=Pedobacter sp. V48 TaxID=509635 RepID=UPI0003E5B7B4|nr:hypothetical protein [Pedobacter sp. V48]ETZ23004.1 hypothetical protein N824_20420 [Pedobacter sp. V48]
MHLLRKYFFLLFIVLICLPFTSFKSVQQTAQEPLLFKPTTFYVTEILDQGAGKDMETAILIRFIKNNLSKDLSLKPVVVEIKELTIRETTTKTGVVEGQIKMQLSFSLKEEDEKKHLMNYSGGMRYSGPASNTSVIDKNLKHLGKSALEYFNTWMNNNIHTNRILASKVKVSFEYYKEQTEGDTIYYATNRPLTWPDFQSTRKMSNKYAAMVMPNIGYDQHEEIAKGVIQVTIILKTYLAKSDCWLSGPYKDDYMLNHEQRHFDIAKIVTEQFRKKIGSAKLTPDTYEAFINMQYLDSYREMNKLQKDYDTGTAHGTNRMAQQNWNKRIDDLLLSKTIPGA